jgi:putative MATE family efflux protein
MVLGNVLQNAFNVVDMIFVGRLGPSAIAAVALCGILMQITWTLLIGVSIGTTAMVARFHGAGQKEKASLTAMQSLTLGIGVSLLLLVLVTLWGDRALLLLGADQEVLPLGRGYLRIVFSGSFTLVMFFLCSAIMRGVGDSVTPMVIMAVSTALNITLDPLLIFGLWIFPELGVRGAALSTVCAQGVGMFAGLYVLFRGHTRLHILWRRYRVDFNLMGRMLRLSLPGTLQGAVRSAANLLLMRIVAGYGVLVLAAYGIGLRLDLIVMMPGWALGAAAATLVGQNLGAGRPRRSEKSAWMAAGLYIILLVVVGFFFFVFPRAVIALFNRETEILAIGSAYLRIRVLSYVFLALGLVMASALNGAGNVLAPLVILTISLLGVQLPLAWVLPRMLANSTNGLWIAVALAFTVQGIGMAAWFRLGRWKKQKV